jgi:hypothetical protein
VCVACVCELHALLFFLGRKLLYFLGRVDLLCVRGRSILGEVVPSRQPTGAAQRQAQKAAAPLAGANGPVGCWLAALPVAGALSSGDL